MKDELTLNAAGRLVPVEVNGERAIPYMGVGNYKPDARKYAPRIPSCTDFPADGYKRIPTLREALLRAGIRDGMTISTHHHLRDGDFLANQVFEIARELGVKGLRWFPSASFPCHAQLIPYLEDGTIDWIEGSMNGPLGEFTSQGRMRKTAVLRSHGGRVQAIQDGEVVIDIAVMAAPAADAFGNANGLSGPSATGVLGYAEMDVQYASCVILVTDNLVPFPCLPMQIAGNFVDFVVQVELLGNAEKIISGTTQITRSPDRLIIAELTARFCEVTGIIYDGCVVQAGAGGISLAVAEFMKQIMIRNGWKIKVGFGGTTQYMVDMLEQGVMEYILDGQVFDTASIRSLNENRNHHSFSVFNAYNFHSKGNLTSLIDVVTLGATEIDVHFNGNVVTHSDGLLLHGIGGWQNCLFARNTIIALPLFRNRIPVIVDKVTTLCGPGELIDVIVTERGIAINPRRKDLLEKVKDSGLPVRRIEELKEEAESICGKPDKPEFTDKIVAVVKWVDGTVLDVVRQVLLNN
jgi:citrate lyase subunit alpha / citrate CoA-transferase